MFTSFDGYELYSLVSLMRPRLEDMGAKAGDDLEMSPDMRQCARFMLTYKGVKYRVYVGHPSIDDGVRS